MWILIIVVIILVILIAILNKVPPVNTNIDEEIPLQYDLSKYQTKHYIMTQTELKFYRILKEITDKLELSIFPQVRLEQIVQVIDNNVKDRNKIKSRSIDYTIVNNKNCKIISCIELDDDSHNRPNVKKVDEFKNNVFKKVGIPLHRIKVQNNYNKDELEKILQEDLQK